MVDHLCDHVCPWSFALYRKHRFFTTSNHLQYALNWSTEGLINEYANLCEILEDGKLVRVPALEGLQSLIIDGRSYEMFYTSGGAGSLVSTHENSVKNLCYKTIRYPGHCEKMRFMMNHIILK